MRGQLLLSIYRYVPAGGRVVHWMEQRNQSKTPWQMECKCGRNLKGGCCVPRARWHLARAGSGHLLARQKSLRAARTTKAEFIRGGGGICEVFVSCGPSLWAMAAESGIAKSLRNIAKSSQKNCQIVKEYRQINKYRHIFWKCLINIMRKYYLCMFKHNISSLISYYSEKVILLDGKWRLDLAKSTCFVPKMAGMVAFGPIEDRMTSGTCTVVLQDGQQKVEMGWGRGV